MTVGGLIDGQEIDDTLDDNDAFSLVFWNETGQQNVWYTLVLYDFNNSLNNLDDACLEWVMPDDAEIAGLLLEVWSPDAVSRTIQVVLEGRVETINGFVTNNKYLLGTEISTSVTVNLASNFTSAISPAAVLGYPVVLPKGSRFRLRINSSAATNVDRVYAQLLVRPKMVRT